MLPFPPSSTFSDRMDAVVSAPLGPFPRPYPPVYPTLYVYPPVDRVCPLLSTHEATFRTRPPRGILPRTKALPSTPVKPLTCETLVQQRTSCVPPAPASYLNTTVRPEVGVTGDASAQVDQRLRKRNCVLRRGISPLTCIRSAMHRPHPWRGGDES